MEIMFDDLIPEAQERLLNEAGVLSPEDMHWDTIPVAVVELIEQDDECDDEIVEDIYGDDYESFLD
jgi:hypothetical protein